MAKHGISLKFAEVRNRRQTKEVKEIPKENQNKRNLLLLLAPLRMYGYPLW